MISRRDFLSAATGLCPFAQTFCAAAAATLLSDNQSSCLFGLDLTADLLRTAPKARYWLSTTASAGNCLKCHDPKENRSGKAHQGQSPIVKCLLCAQGCFLKTGERGKCRARMNVNGEMRSLVYGRPVAIHLDPIEKKPFYHFLPGSTAFSLATAGCPLHCKFCQNWEISQSRPEDHQVDFTPPDSVVGMSVTRGAPIVAFTYNEPTVFTEYMTDIAKLARKKKLRSVLISCGFMTSEPLAEMCEVLDAIKIDLKGYSEDFYRNVCSAELQPVLRSIKQIAKSGIHLEIVNLVVPTLNDSEPMLRALSEWIMGELGPDVPVHFTRFHPDYQLLNLPATPIAALERARDLALKQGIHYAFVGNVPGHPGNHTYCPSCGKIVIKRNSFFVEEMNVKNGHCLFCGRAIAGIWD
jgi:pyruvate formate lyase activating enzyme